VKQQARRKFGTEVSVDTLLDDAVELYSQLAVVCGLGELDYDPIAPDGATEAIQALRPLGEEGFLELTATSFGAGRGPSVRVRMGGEIGRVIPLINDVAEALVTLQTLWPAVQGSAIFERLVRCQLPSELNELLRLSVGPYPSAVSQPKSLLALYEEPGMPRAPRDQLRGLRDSITPSTRADLLEWRNKVGAHTDAELAWQEIDESIETRRRARARPRRPCAPVARLCRVLRARAGAAARARPALDAREGHGNDGEPRLRRPGHAAAGVRQPPSGDRELACHVLGAGAARVPRKCGTSRRDRATHRGAERPTRGCTPDHAGTSGVMPC
jgi:hypothetical protein